MAVLEEFKKEFVQDLARYMIEKNEPRDQMWSRLKSVYGLDCKLLWERIRSLTVKKLSKMLEAEDRTESIPAIAQMTSNDWLVFDNILVHENIDVIGKPSILSGHPESKVLWELYILVCSYHIENLPPENVAKGWHNLTKIYNTSGRYCSAMLLQLRWYQLKELVRMNFQNFWSIYQGKSNYMNEVPRASKLQKLIASRYGNILAWEGLIKKKLVLKDSHLENCSQLDQSETSNDDLEVIEIKPSIETIDLDTDSESDDDLENETSKQSITGINDIDQIEPKNTFINDHNYHEDTLTSSVVSSKVINVKRNVDFEKSEYLVCMTEQHQDLTRNVTKNLEVGKTVENINFTDEELPQCKDIEIVNQYGQVEIENEDKSTVVKLENKCEEENYSAQTIDPKLLMFPISYTKKLDHMSMFKNRDYLIIKGNHIIKRIEAESKPMILKYDYPKKYEIPQINSTGEMRQKQKKRTYSFKQLQTNPDFFVRLKNIPVNFLLNERNRRLLNYCKPVTVDIDRLIETNPTNNPNLEDLSNKVKHGKDSYELKSSDYILGKSIEDINASLQQNEISKSVKSFNSTENDRNVEKLGQNLLAIEVSPLFSNNSCTNPPVKLVQFEKDVPNHENAKEIDDYINKSSYTSLIEESPVDKSKVNIKLLLPQQNKFHKSSNVGVSKSKINTVVKLMRCPVDTSNNYDKLKESKLGSDVKSLHLAEQAAEILRKQRINQVVRKMIDHPLKKIPQTREPNSILPKNSLKEVVKLIKGPFKKTDTVQVPKSNMPSQNSVALFLTKVSNDEKTGTVISDRPKKSQILCEGVTEIKSSTNIRDKSISDESKNCQWHQNEVQKQEDSKKLRHFCTKLCECTEYRNIKESCANDRLNNLNSVVTSLPHQNLLINLQCETKQNSLYLVVSPLKNNSDQEKSILTKVDKEQLDNGQFKKAPLPNSLIVTRVSSEPTHSFCERNDQNYIKAPNAISKLNASNFNSNTQEVSSYSVTPISPNNDFFAKAENKEIIGRIEAKNGNIQIIPRKNIEKEVNRESKRKLSVDLTDICDSRQAKRKANVLVQSNKVRHFNSSN